MKSNSVNTNSTCKGPEAELPLLWFGRGQTERRSVSEEVRGPEVGRRQTTESVTGLSEEFGFYSKFGENIWEVLVEKWHVLIHIF